MLVSARNLDSVLVVRDPGAVGDPNAGEIIARYGGQLSTVTFNDPPYDGYARPHDAHLLPNGNLLVYDDRTPGDHFPVEGTPERSSTGSTATY